MAALLAGGLYMCWIDSTARVELNFIKHIVFSMHILIDTHSILHKDPVSFEKSRWSLKPVLYPNPFLAISEHILAT